VPGVRWGGKGPRDAVPTLVVRQVKWLPHDPRCACITALAGAQYGLDILRSTPPCPRGSHEAHRCVPQSCSSTCAYMYLYPTPRAKVASCRGGRERVYPTWWPRGRRGRLGQAWQARQGRQGREVILSIPTGATQPRATPSNWWFGAQDPPRPRISSLPRPVRLWKALPGTHSCTSLGQPPGGLLVDIVCQHPTQAHPWIRSFIDLGPSPPTRSSSLGLPKPRQHKYKSSISLKFIIVLRTPGHIIACTPYRQGH
jgi:hypothetical protein